MQGQTRWPPLTAVGLRQAHAVAELLAASDRPRRLLSSDLCRAVQSASIIAEHLDLPVETTPLLRERCWGIYEGRPIIEGQLYEEKLCAFERVPKGESREDVADRVRTLLAGIADTGPVALVTHGDVIREAMALFSELSEPIVRAQTIDNGRVVTLQFPSGKTEYTIR